MFLFCHFICVIRLTNKPIQLITLMESHQIANQPHIYRIHLALTWTIPFPPFLLSNIWKDQTTNRNSLDEQKNLFANYFSFFLRCFTSLVQVIQVFLLFPLLPPPPTSNLSATKIEVKQKKCKQNKLSKRKKNEIKRKINHIGKNNIINPCSWTSSSVSSLAKLYIHRV